MGTESDVDERLLQAAKAGDDAGVRAALKAGANVNATDGGGRTALMEATARGHVDVMRVLLDAEADVDAVGAMGETALIVACAGRARDTVPVLLRRGADPTIADRDKKTVLMWLVDLQFHRGGVPTLVIPSLVDAGAVPNARDHLGRTALMWAAQGDLSSPVRPAVLKALLETGADVDIKDDRGETVLFFLTRYIDDVLDLDGGKDCVQLVLAAGVDPEVRNVDGKTALGIVDPGNTLAIDMLKGLGLRE